MNWTRKWVGIVCLLLVVLAVLCVFGWTRVLLHREATQQASCNGNMSMIFRYCMEYEQMYGTNLFVSAVDFEDLMSKLVQADILEPRIELTLRCGGLNGSPYVLVKSRDDGTVLVDEVENAHKSLGLNKLLSDGMVLHSTTPPTQITHPTDIEPEIPPK